MMPLVSCIVPVFNGERYLREALDSILAQTYRPLEVIVIDDGSTDGTPRIVAGYGPEIRYLFQPNAGPAAARNLGLRAARGELIAFLDADDLWHPEKLARQVARLQARPERDLCIVHVQNFWDAPPGEEAERFRDHRSAQAQPGYTCQSLLARRALFETVGEFNPAFLVSDDIDWFARALDRGAVIEVLPDVLVRRRLHHTNLTSSSPLRFREGALHVLKATLDRRRREQGTGNG